ncbi:methyltransferase domain-containing protein [Desulforhopalus sp. IMCC35007]|uniref:methyltransferase domain-containing protein n=1 Tax=Desulforhopalus sp. IMCC35007 TaxID=2569543 RepID=UPI0010AE2550|nr:methyltransferase domain-containing protein [Desulforhopalus sp. IMCC35007]TKB09333.1 methyltransferase domain-containing protein [Desulforhopalus sp. IMCC35007]
MNVITRSTVNKQLVADSFRLGADTYDEHATVQKELSSLLVKRLIQNTSGVFKKALEVGCCTGLLTKELGLLCSVDQLYVNDIVPSFCEDCVAQLNGYPGVRYPLPGDIEKCALPNNLDLIISSSTLQWAENLPQLLETLISRLNCGGVLAISLFTSGTMKEVTTLTGSGLYYHGHGELSEFFRERGLLLHDENVARKMIFPTVRAILRHIKMTGVGGVGQVSWTHNGLRTFEDQYRKQFAMEEGLPVSFSSSLFIVQVK